MLLVKTRLASSTIHGLGIFAVDPIPQGTIIWRFVEGWDRQLTTEQVKSLPELAQCFVETYAGLSRKTALRVLTADDDRFWNHSDNPNCQCSYVDWEIESLVVASRDIQPNEELTCDYNQFCQIGLVFGKDG